MLTPTIPPTPCRLTDAFLDGTVEKPLFEDRKAALLMERKELEESLASLRDQTRSLPDRLSEFLELAGSVLLSYKTALVEEKRDLLKIVTSNRRVDGKKLAITMSFPFCEVANRHQNSNGVFIVPSSNLLSKQMMRRKPHALASTPATPKEKTLLAFWILRAPDFF